MLQTTRGPVAAPRLVGVQMLRGVAAVLVVLAHSIDLALRNENAFGTTYVARLGHVENMGAVGVDLFFVISGFVMALSIRTLVGWSAARTFLLRRWIRIAPAYTVATLVFVALTALRGADLPSWRSWSNLVLIVPVLDGDQYTRPPLSVGWTLSFEMLFYLLMALTVAIGWARVPTRLPVLLSVAGAATLGWTFHPVLLAWLLNPILIEFVLGMMACALWQAGWSGFAQPRVRLALAGAGGAALLVQVVTGSGKVSQAGRVLDGSLSLERVVLWGVPAALLFLAWLPARVDRRTASGRWLLRVGDASYSIYLIHLSALLVLGEVLRLSPVALGGDVVVLLAAATGVMAGLGFHRTVEVPLTALVGRSLQSARVTTTGAWSLAPFPARSSRSTKASTTRAASAGEPSTKSIRMPLFRS